MENITKLHWPILLEEGALTKTGDRDSAPAGWRMVVQFLSNDHHHNIISHHFLQEQRHEPCVEIPSNLHYAQCAIQPFYFSARYLYYYNLPSTGTTMDGLMLLCVMFLHKNQTTDNRQ
jgi:hypothetical protein